MSDIVIYESDDWSAVYEGGRLIRVFTAYLADEWVRKHFNVKTVQGDEFLLGQNHRDGAAQTIDQIEKYVKERDARMAEAARLRAEASALIIRAEKLTSTPEEE